MAPTRASKRKRAPKRNKHFVRSVHRIEMGSVINPPADPPSWTSAPWWPITVTAVAIKAQSYTSKDLWALVLTSLSLQNFKDGNNNVRMRLRFIDVRCWGLSRQPISLNIPRLNSIGTRVKQLNDRGTTTRYSKLGWRFGIDSQLAVDYDDTDVVFEVGGDFQSGTILIYIRVMFQLIGIKSVAEIASQQTRNTTDQFVHLQME